MSLSIRTYTLHQPQTCFGHSNLQLSKLIIERHVFWWVELWTSLQTFLTIDRTLYQPRSTWLHESINIIFKHEHRLSPSHKKYQAIIFIDISSSYDTVSYDPWSPGKHREYCIGKNGWRVWCVGPSRSSSQSRTCVQLSTVLYCSSGPFLRVRCCSVSSFWIRALYSRFQ